MATWDKGIQQNKNETHRWSDVTEHLEKLLLGMLEKLMVRAFGINLELGTEKLKQIKKKWGNVLLVGKPEKFTERTYSWSTLFASIVSDSHIIRINVH